MKVAILGAMREEIEPLKKIFGVLKENAYAQNVFYEARYKGLDLVMAYSKIGKVNAALTASLMIEKFGAQKLIFTGVAGALAGGLRVGDLVIASKLVQHDVDITAFGHAPGFIPESGDFVSCDADLVRLAATSAADLGLRTKEGVIATGDQFVASKEKKEFISSTYGAAATEMEGAAVAYVCKCLEVPFVVLRSISDASDDDASISFDEFLETSAEQSAKLCVRMLDGLNA